MPSIYLHNYFSKDAYRRINDDKIIKPKDQTYFLLFSQSFDYLFSYNFLKLKKGKDIRKFGYYAHTHNVWDYFKNMLTFIKENKLFDDENIGYLYGSLSHYALDSTFHPYIHYISGRFNFKDKKHTKKYMGYHAINEIMLDAIYYNKDHPGVYYKYKLYNDPNFFQKILFDNKIIKTINYTYKKTFNRDNMGLIYNNAYLQHKNIYKYLMYDRSDIKKGLYKVIDIITPFKNFKAYSYSHHIKKVNTDILNEKHNTWLHPVTGEKFHKSVSDLYEESMNKLLSYIKISNEFFNNKCSIEDVEKIIQNNSYSSGLDANIRPIFQYFKN